MLRSYRRIIFAAFIGLAVCSPGQSQSTGSGNKIAQEAKGGSGSKHEAPADAASTIANNLNGEQASEADCGTPKECRAEQREKDDLVAQQTAATAAAEQANLSKWQTFIATLGVLAVIATLIYTHRATSAALQSVNLLTVIERPHIGITIGEGVLIHGVGGIFFHFALTNSGRTTAILRETAFCIQPDPLFSNFKPMLTRKHNTFLPATTHDAFTQKIQVSPFFGERVYFSGYYEWDSEIRKKRSRDYFCVEIVDGTLITKNALGEDWPPDTD